MIKKWFFSHQGKIPSRYVLRPLGATLVTLLLLLQPFINNLISAHQFRLASYATSISESAIFARTNQERAAAGVSALHENAELDNAAHAKALDMFSKDYWAHNSPTGETPWDFIVAAGYHYSAAAENLAMDFDTSSDVISGWMNSPEHRTNMLNEAYSDVGIAVMNGTLTGEQTTLVIMELGHPAIAPVPIPAAALPQTPKTPTPPPTIAAPPAHQTPASAKPIALKPIVQANTTPMQTVDPNPLMSLSALHATVESVNWAQWTMLLLTITVLLLSYVRQSYVWRIHKRIPWQTRWLRAHPMLQVNLATCAGALMIGSSTGMLR